MNFKIQPPPGPRTSIIHLVRWTQYFFLAVGILALSYCATVLLERVLFQAYQTWQFDRALKAAQSSPRTVQPPASSALAIQVEEDRARAASLGIDGLAGSPLGRIEISSIGLAAMIMEGVDGKTLRRAVGHIPGTALPGRPGNVALAAHRDTFFRGLRNVHMNDEITLTTLDGASRYRVDSAQVVGPEDIEVLRPTPDDILTLVACYPFYFVGPAPQRFVVRAHRLTE